VSAIRNIPRRPVSSLPDLKTVGTHDSAFTRGHLFGYCAAMIERRAGFKTWVLSSQQADVAALLIDAGATYKFDGLNLNAYGVEHVRVRVEFP
jgi:hypothetical protein